MKKNLPLKKLRNHRAAYWKWLGAFVIGAAFAAGSVRAGEGEAEEMAATEEEEAPADAAAEAEPLTPEQMFEGGAEPLVNRVELGIGGMFIDGSKAQAEQRHYLADGPFGGIQDLHYQQQVAEGTTLSLDGRALFDLNDYDLSLRLVNEKYGFVRLRYREFRTWYNGNGGYYHPADLWFPLSGSALELDRGEFSIQAGLTLANWPRITFEYIHQFREGEKGSTAWGPVNLGFHDPNFAGTRAIAPSFYDIDEQRDIFRLDVTHRMKKTDFGIGARYEIGDMNNARKMLLRPQEPVERRVTHRDRTSDDTVSAHAFTETWLRNDLLFSSGFLFATMDGNFSGSRIYGDDFDVGYVPNALNGTGYIDLDGAMQSREYVLNLNLMATPFTNFTVVPSVRVRREDWEADSSYLQTSGAGAPVPAVAESDGNLLDVQERLDVRYTGFTNWVLFARGEWTQGEGDLDERFATATTVAARLRETEDERFFQKYSVGARWYPARAVTVDFGGYFKKNRYDYDHVFDSTSNAGGNRYPAYLVLQEFETYDAHARLTLRPFSKVTLTSRYEYQVSTIRTEPDAASGLIQAQSSEMTSHIFGQTASWVPWSRLALQAGFNLVVSETDTPTSKFTQAVLDWQNNYWTANLNSTLVLDDKTDLHVGYFYYSSENFQNNSLEGLPLGAEASEHGATAMLSRRLSPRLRWNLRYAFFHSESELYGGKNDYDAHALFSSLQYRF